MLEIDAGAVRVELRAAVCNSRDLAEMLFDCTPWTNSTDLGRDTARHRCRGCPEMNSGAWVCASTQDGSLTMCCRTVPSTDCCKRSGYSVVAILTVCSADNFVAHRCARDSCSSANVATPGPISSVMVASAADPVARSDCSLRNYCTCLLKVSGWYSWLLWLSMSSAFPDDE